MSKTDYPQDPQNSFAQAPYNSPGMPIHAASSVSLSFTPPVADFSGVLTHRPKNISDGTNVFCDTTGFRAEFHNGLSTEVSELSLRVVLPPGFDYDNTRPAQVKFGAGSWQSAASVQQSGGYLNISLSSANQVLGAYGTAAATAYVDFRLRISCGATNKQQIYAEFIGESGCGAQVSKTSNSGQIKIAGIAAMPTYWVTDLSVPPQPQPVYTSSSTPNDGSFSFSGKYTRTVIAGGDDLYALIELPPNLNLTAQSGSDLNFTQSGTRLTAILPKSDGVGDPRTFNLTLSPVNPQLWNEDSVRINFYTETESTMSCDGTQCSVLDRSESLDSIKFAMQKLDIRYSDSITARGSYGNENAEHVLIDGWLVNEGVSSNFNAGALTMELWYNNGTNYVPTGAAVSGLTVSSVTYDDSTRFTVEANIPYTENVCSMLLVLRKTGSGASNPYLADSIAIAVPSPVYEITAQHAPICQMAVNTSVGDKAITGYSYSWSPATYLSTGNGTPVNFTYDYNTSPLPDGATLQYFVSITRPNGCTSVDTVFVKLKGIPAVKPTDDTVLCDGAGLIINFEDPTNSGGPPTTFNWTVTALTGSISGTGLPASGNGSINVSSLVNKTNAAIVASCTVTPQKDACDGVADIFDITINPCPTMHTVSGYPLIVCDSEQIPSILFGTDISNPAVEYSWTVGNYASLGLSSASGTDNIPQMTAVNNTADTIRAVFKVSPKIGDCTGTEQEFMIKIRVRLAQNAPAVSEDTICYNTASGQISGGTVIGGAIPYSYQWQDSTDGVNWADISGETGENCQSADLTLTTHYRRIVTSSANCGKDTSSTVTITVLPSSLLNYPDLRIRVCPDGTDVNLSKYIDTLYLTGAPQWKKLSGIPIGEYTGVIPASSLGTARMHTFSYTLGNPCVSNITRKVYLETLEPGRIRPLRDSISVCYKYAEALQLNQIFGVDAGSSSWTYTGDDGSDLSTYVSESLTYGGAETMDAKAVYENTSVRRISITYTPTDSCFAGKPFTIKIILTDL
jgi:hypothetical protein